MGESFFRGRAGIVLAACLISGQVAAGAHPTEANADDLMDLSLEELMEVEITTFSRKPTALSDAPAAVFAVSSRDIERSGARSIPDLLRMVPGLQVAQADSNSWAVTARGSNGLFANKLLVLMDGRTLYTPSFSGVFWDLQDTDLSSIERIEVIRGPGATMWGSNAVNGVINVITKKAAETPGLQGSLIAGSHRRAGQVAYGGSVAAADYRIYAKYFDRDGFADGGHDEWDMLRGGLRLDFNPGADDEVFFSSEFFAGTIGEAALVTSLDPPYNSFVDVERDSTGGFALVGWNRTLSETSSFQLRAFYDRTRQREVTPNETRDTYDIDFQHRFELAGRHDIVWGASYRLSKDDTNGSFTFSLDPPDRTQRLFGAFVQDEIRLTADDLFLTVGTKIEKNSFSNNDIEWEPNVRLSWHATENQTLWSSVARAIRVPSRAELSATINAAVAPAGAPGNPFPVPFVFGSIGDPEFETEEVVAYELGYRNRLSDSVNFDLAVFYNEYDKLRTETPLAPQCVPGEIPVFVNPGCAAAADYVRLPLQITNSDRSVSSHGAELAVDYRISADWWIHGAYTYLNSDEDSGAGAAAAGQDAPEHQLSVRSSMNPTADTELDLWLRYVDELEAQQIDSYVTLDARLAWTGFEGLELALVGRNLLEDRHAEFVEEFGNSVPTEVEREAYVELRWHFQ